MTLRPWRVRAFVKRGGFFDLVSTYTFATRAAAEHRAETIMHANKLKPLGPEWSVQVRGPKKAVA